jgi:DNA polymerase-3 subunit delta'
MSGDNQLIWWDQSYLDRDTWGELAQPMIDRICTARDRQRLPQAVMLIGPPGLGRELAAVEAAALLTCRQGSGPWCDCNSCGRVRAGIHPDVVAVIPQGSSRQIKIDQVRKVVEDASGRPFEGKRRIWIFDGVEAGGFGAEAANAFLKTLEEPPEHTRFILLAANPEAVLATIRSRCQRLSLPGAVAVADRFGKIKGPPELATAALAGKELAISLEQVTTAVRASFKGEVLELVRVARRLAGEDDPFAIVAAAALEAIGAGGSQHAEGLVQLAAQALASGRRTQALNLNRERQLLACMLSWHQSRSIPQDSAQNQGRLP